MALNGIGGFQQLPIATTYQPGQNSGQVRQDEQKPQENRVQAKGAPAAGVQKSDTGNTDNAVRRADARDSNTQSSSASQQRGSLLDITV